jgi:tripartite-type tricarboxylate transporter receptor subunit TctC
MVGHACAGRNAAGCSRKLNAAINEGLRSADMQMTLKRLGAEARGGTSQEFAAFLASEVQRWAAIIAATRIKPE